MAFTGWSWSISFLTCGLRRGADKRMTLPDSLSLRRSSPGKPHPAFVIPPFTHTNYITLIQIMDQSATATATMGNQPIDESLYSRQLSVLISFIPSFLLPLPSTSIVHRDYRPGPFLSTPLFL